MHPIDCHILLDPHRERFHAGCLDSLKNEPVNVYTLPSTAGDIAQGRIAGFSLGSSPYLTFVDDDDELHPGAYQACLDALEAAPNTIGAFSDEVLIDVDGNITGPGRSTGLDWTFARQLTLMPFIHHGVVMRRAAVMQLLPELERWHKYPEQVLFGLLAQIGNWVHVPIPGYRWRRHDNQVTHTSNQEAGEVIKFLAGFIPGREI
jgi:hypothetical protein